MKKADIGVAAYVLAAFIMMIVPIPSGLLDLLLACNIAIAFTVMFSVMFSKEVLGYVLLPNNIIVYYYIQNFAEYFVYQIDFNYR